MERARATWTDERLDDLSNRVEHGFDRVSADLRAIRTEMNARFDAEWGRVDARFDEQGGRMDARFEAQSARFDARLDARFDELSRRIDALQRIMIQFGGGITLAVLATLVSVIATRA